MKEIKLTQGKIAIVDDEDYEHLSGFKWHAQKNGNTFYARRGASIGNGKQKTIRMHREIFKVPDGLAMDHVNGNGLDNRKINLRIATSRQNSQNRHQSTTSKYPGVTWHVNRRKWQAQMHIDGVHRYLGLFPTEEEAFNKYKHMVHDIGEQILENNQVQEVGI